MRTFYSDSLRRVLETLNTDPDRGLSGQEAARRLERARGHVREAIRLEVL